MATATAIRLETPHYFCDYCDEITEGEPKKVMAKDLSKMIMLDSDGDYLSVEEWDKAPFIEVLICPGCGFAQPTPSESSELVVIPPGTTVFECEEDEIWWLTRPEAEACCV